MNHSKKDDSLDAALRRVRLVVFDFDGVFTDNRVYVSQEGIESVCCYRGDGLGLRLLDQIGVRYLILTSERNPVVTARANKLGIRAIVADGDKQTALEHIITEWDVPLNQVAFVGNDINDRDCLQMVGCPIVVRDAHPSVLPLARYRTRRKGGNGAVREVCDLIFEAHEPARTSDRNG